MDRIQLRRDTAARWAEINPVLLEGEVGYETDTKLRKIGDGVKRWNELGYLKAEGIVQETGAGENVVMSQKAVSGELAELGSKIHSVSHLVSQGSWFKMYHFVQGEQYTITNGGSGAVTLFLLDTNDSSSSHRIQTISSGGIGGGQSVTFVAEVDAMYIGGYANGKTTINIDWNNSLTNKISKNKEELLTLGALISCKSSQYPIISLEGNNITFSKNGFSVIFDNKIHYVGYVDGVDSSETFTITPRDVTREYFVINRDRLIVDEVVAFSHAISKMQYLDGFDPKRHILLVSYYQSKIIWNGLLNSELAKHEVGRIDDKLNSLGKTFFPDKIEGTAKSYWTLNFQFKKGERYTINNKGEQSATAFLLSANDSHSDYRIQTISSGGIGGGQSVTFVAEVDAMYIGGYANGTTIEVLRAFSVSENINEVFGDSTDITSIYPRDSWSKKSMEDNSEFKCLFFSDIHKGEVNLERILQLAKYFGATSVDTIINGGDTVSNLITESLDWFDEQINKSPFDVLSCVGNHDMWIDNDWTLADATEIYSNVISPIASRVSNLIQPTDAASKGKCYYYKDYGNVRVIVLNAISVTWRNLFWDSEQAAWLEDVLNSAKESNKSVICVSHAPFDKTAATIVQSSWTSFKAYERKEDINHERYDAHRINEEAVAIVKNFVNKGGAFICWLTGHNHIDAIYKCEGQLMLNITSANYAKKSDGITATTVEQRQYDAFNYICVDTTHSLIKVMRIGWNMSADMKKRNPLCINYVTGEIFAD